MWVRLTRRLATHIDGVNLSVHRVGDVFEVTRREAELLIAEDWAVPVALRARSLHVPGTRLSRATREDRRALLNADHLHDIRADIQQRSLRRHDHRRAEDRIRDEW